MQRGCTACLIAFLVCAISPAADSQTLFASSNASAADLWMDNATVTTACGIVQGSADNHTTWVWKAIPYALPPVGQLRWKAPQDPQPWTNKLQNNEFCSWCTQSGNDNGSSVVKGSEDCLYLNIWRPRTAETNLPVFFWIHGGSNKKGSADLYKGAPIAGSQNMIVVTINYRLGPLGWFTHPALREGQDGLDSSGNYATLDIIKALSWVHDNIEAFGGSPSTVTVAGQSAGGVNVFTLMMSPLAKGLFHRVISQSGGIEPNTIKAGDHYANAVIEALLVHDGTPEQSAAEARGQMSAAETAAYLRSKTAYDFFAATSELKGNPDIFTDGAVIPTEGTEVFDDPNTFNQVPLIIGTNAEEGKLFLYMMGLEQKLNNVMYQFLGGKLSQISRRTGIDKLAYTLSSHANQPGVYCSIFQYGQYRARGYNAWPTDTGPTETMSWAVALGACHGLDIPFNFGIAGEFPVFKGLEKLVFRDDNRPGWQSLSDAMMTYNAQFARTGNPNGDALLPVWSQWPDSKFSTGPRFMLFDADAEKSILEMARDVRYGR